MSARRKVGDMVAVAGYGVCVLEPCGHNDNPWSCTNNCGDPDCVEWLAFESGGALHVNECEMRTPDPGGA